MIRGWYTVYVSQFGYGISPRALSWFRSPAGQKTSSTVSEFLVTPPALDVLVVLTLLVVLVVDEVEEVLEVEDAPAPPEVRK